MFEQKCNVDNGNQYQKNVGLLLLSNGRQKSLAIFYKLGIQKSGPRNCSFSKNNVVNLKFENLRKAINLILQKVNLNLIGIFGTAF